MIANHSEDLRKLHDECNECFYHFPFIFIHSLDSTAFSVSLRHFDISKGYNCKSIKKKKKKREETLK